MRSLERVEMGRDVHLTLGVCLSLRETNFHSNLDLVDK